MLVFCSECICCIFYYKLYGNKDRQWKIDKGVDYIFCDSAAGKDDKLFFLFLLETLCLYWHKKIVIFLSDHLTIWRRLCKQYKYRISLYRKKRNWSWKLSQIFMETSNHIIKIEFLKWNWTDTMMIQTHLLMKSYFAYSRIEVIWRQ